jgi:hypothetical protein
LGFKKNGSEYRSRFDVFTTRWIVLCHSIPLLDRAHNILLGVPRPEHPTYRQLTVA